MTKIYNSIIKKLIEAEHILIVVEDAGNYNDRRIKLHDNYTEDNWEKERSYRLPFFLFENNNIYIYYILFCILPWNLKSLMREKWNNELKLTI